MSVDSQYKEHHLHYFDGTDKVVKVTDIETPFPEGKLIVSRTDTQGVITHMNQAFVDMSAYSEEELVGQPHSILRHPDMPKSIFKEAWDVVGAGNKWNGYVKNLRKDGGFYWVYATIIPNMRNGEMVAVSSVRRKPSAKKLVEIKQQYQQLLSEEVS
ncbi:MAG: PAS domain-containing protein [Sinobacterium sp.]|nr:PAS domain-containing protein [Sinobacterium sp.]